MYALCATAISEHQGLKHCHQLRQLQTNKAIGLENFFVPLASVITTSLMHGSI